MPAGQPSIYNPSYSVRARLVNAFHLARQKFWGEGAGRNAYPDSSFIDKGPDLLNGHFLQSLDYLGTSYADLVGMSRDPQNLHMLMSAFQNGQRTPIKCQIQPQASIVTGTPFFVNGNSAIPLEIVRIDCTFATANGAALTGNITKEPAAPSGAITGAPGTGPSCMSGTFNLNATANTLQIATLAGVRFTQSLVLYPGEQLSLVLSTTTTSLAGLEITVWVKPYYGSVPATLFLQANGAIATKQFYLNIMPGRTVTGVAARWAVAGTDAGAVTLDITKDTSTNAPGAGTSILAATQSLKATANTTVYPALTATAATLLMASGDRLSFKLTGTPTALVGLVISVFFDNGCEDTFTIQAPSLLNAGVDFNFFTADHFYLVEDFWGVWSVAGGAGATATLTRDSGTSGPGAGTAVLTGTLDETATAQTPLEGTLVSVKPTLILQPGDRLGIKHGGTVGSLAGELYATRLRKM